MPNYSSQPIKMSNLEIFFNLFMHLRKLFMVSHLLKNHCLVCIIRAVIFIWSLPCLWWQGWMRHWGDSDHWSERWRALDTFPRLLSDQSIKTSSHKFTRAGPLLITKSKKSWLSVWFNPIRTGRENVQKYYSLKYTFDIYLICYTFGGQLNQIFLVMILIRHLHQICINVSM